MSVESSRRQSRQSQDGRSRWKINREKKEFRQPIVEEKMEIARIVEEKQEEKKNMM